jgi:ssDNA-binding replication factor A large subunit
MNDRSGLTVNPPGIIVGEVKPVAQAQPQAPTKRKRIKDIVEGDVNVEVLATVVQMFNPNFFEVCPNCGKRAVESTCPDHGRVTPTMAYVANAVLDDGTGNIRTAFYRQQLLRLLGVGEAELLKVKTAPEAYESIKKAIIPKVIKVIGRAKKNPLSNNVEFTANLVFMDFDVKKEAELLKAELK